MATRSSARWQIKPGSFDPLHTDQLFTADGNPYGIPSIPHAPLTYTPAWLTPYRTRIRSKNGTGGGAVHFFLDDYRFETTWSRPNKALQYLHDFKTLLTPDFSLYPDWPLATQIWNVYRSRWCGAYWDSLGFQVIPTVSWAGRESYNFSFAGIARHSLVAISPVGVKASDRSAFAYGFHEMIERIAPSCVLCYGNLPTELESLAEVRAYPTRWRGIKHEVASDGR
jgi:hypothetical protein